MRFDPKGSEDKPTVIEIYFDDRFNNDVCNFLQIEHSEKDCDGKDTGKVRTENYIFGSLHSSLKNTLRHTAKELGKLLLLVEKVDPEADRRSRGHQ